MQVGNMVKWTGRGGKQMNRVRKNRGIRPNDVGLIMRCDDHHKDGITATKEVYVMINGRFEYFQVCEMELIS